MKWRALVTVFFFCAAVHAQRRVQTIVPLQPVTVGTAFQVQYIVTGSVPVTGLQAPAFGPDFRFVSGPRLYQGEAFINNTKTPIQNFSYTLIPLRTGRLVVKGATAVYKWGKARSRNAVVLVTDKPHDDGLTTMPLTDLPRLAPGPSWNEKLHDYLFIKADINKQTCFAGEPVVATFTLFSRLPSASEIIKNPGFYGCSVLDISDAADGQQTVQTHNGTFYNVHVLRKLQLYPLQPGNLVIDKMAVNNAIEYLDSASGAPVQTTVLLESLPLTIAVKPLPATAAGSNSGAVGAFSINAYLEKSEWRQNNTGKVAVTISGKGNFLQLSAPEISWPKGIEVFEPAVTERLQKDAVPVAGSRTYTYTFTADSAGKYALPPVSFTYFNPVEKRYKTAVTDSLAFTVSKAKARIALPFTLPKKDSGSYTFIWIIGALVLCMVAALFLFRKYSAQKKDAATVGENKPPDFEKQIQVINAADNDRYRQLQQSLMGFLKSLNRDVHPLKGTLQQTAFPNTNAFKQMGVEEILEECQAVQYYNATPTLPFSELQQQTLHFIRSAKRPN